MATWLPIVPDMTSNAASLPVRSAIKASRSSVDLSSWNTSSLRVDPWIAASMLIVGVVTTSDLKSNSALPGEVHALDSSPAIVDGILKADPENFLVLFMTTVRD